MIDRDARNKAIPLLIEYRRSGFIDQPLKASWPKSRDKALAEILFHILPKPAVKAKSNHLTVTVPYTNEEEKRATVYRCILFLETNLEYPWPAQSYRHRAFSALIAVVLVGMVLIAMYLKLHGEFHFLVLIALGALNYLWVKASRRLTSRGDFKVWPFFTVADCERERERVELQKGFGLADYWQEVET